MKPLQLELAKAKSGSPDKFWDDPTWIAENKLDGWRYACHFGGNLDRAFFTGRRISKESGDYSEKGVLVPHLWPTLRLGLTVIDGEIMPPIGSGFRDIAGIMNVAPEDAAKRIAEIGPPQYFAFDLLFLDGNDIRDLCQMERKQKLTQLIERLDNPLISVIESRDDKLAYYDSIVEAGGEGIILKDVTAPYGSGWRKVKRFSTLDVIVTGFTDAKEGRTGKFLGQIGAAEVSVYLGDGTLVEVGRVSGMDDATRLDMTANPAQWIGSVIEVAAQEFGKDRLRHPRYKRRRLDADPRHATYKKMMADLGAGTETTEARVVSGEQQTLKF